MQHDSVGSPVMEYANTSRQYSHDFSFANSQDSSTGYPYPPSVSCEPGPGSYSSFRSGYSSIRFSGYSGASGQEGRRHSVDAYGTGDHSPIVLVHPEIVLFCAICLLDEVMFHYPFKRRWVRSC